METYEGQRYFREVFAISIDQEAFLTKTGAGVGLGAKSNLLPECMQPPSLQQSIMQQLPHHVASAKRVIYLLQSGGPVQMELFDYKPLLKER